MGREAFGQRWRKETEERHETTHNRSVKSVLERERKSKRNGAVLSRAENFLLAISRSKIEQQLPPIPISYLCARVFRGLKNRRRRLVVESESESREIVSGVNLLPFPPTPLPLLVLIPAAQALPLSPLDAGQKGLDWNSPNVHAE